MDSFVDIFCLKNPRNFCLKSEENQEIFFFVTQIFLSQNVPLYLLIALWTTLLRTTCWKREKNWESVGKLKKYTLFLKTFFWIIAILPYNAWEKRYFSERFAILENVFFFKISIVGELAADWVFEKSSLQLRHSLQKGKLFAFENLKISRIVF